MTAVDFLSVWVFSFALVFGACIGSFLNVVIARLPKGESIVWPGSACCTCRSPIRWYDNIPVLSYCILMGRCRQCRARISLRYPLVELLTAFLGIAFLVRFGVGWELFQWFPLAAALIAIAFIDIDHWVIPDVVVFPAAGWVVLGLFLFDSIEPVMALLGLLPAGVLFGVGWAFEKLLGREGLGLGDVKLLGLLGLAVGPFTALNILLIASLQGSLWGIGLRLFGSEHEAQKNGAILPEGSQFDDGWVPPPYAIPFGPFLVLATFQSVLLPDVLGNVVKNFSDFFTRVFA